MIEDDQHRQLRNDCESELQTRQDLREDGRQQKGGSKLYSKLISYLHLKPLFLNVAVEYGDCLPFSR